MGKRDARCYAALCSLGFCLSPRMKCLEGHQREIMGLVIIDHWAQKSVSARFVFFFLGIMLLYAVGNTPFVSILGTSALPCRDGMKILRRHRQRKKERKKFCR